MKGNLFFYTWKVHRHATLLILALFIPNHKDSASSCLTFLGTFSEFLVHLCLISWKTLESFRDWQLKVSFTVDRVWVYLSPIYLSKYAENFLVLVCKGVESVSYLAIQNMHASHLAFQTMKIPSKSVCQVVWTEWIHTNRLNHFKASVKHMGNKWLHKHGLSFSNKMSLFLEFMP